LERGAVKGGQAQGGGGGLRPPLPPTSTGGSGGTLQSASNPGGVARPSHLLSLARQDPLPWALHQTRQWSTPCTLITRVRSPLRCGAPPAVPLVALPRPAWHGAPSCCPRGQGIHVAGGPRGRLWAVPGVCPAHFPALRPGVQPGLQPVTSDTQPWRQAYRLASRLA